MEIKLLYNDFGQSGFWKITPVKPSSEEFILEFLDNLNTRLDITTVDYRLVCSYLLGHPELKDFVIKKDGAYQDAIVWCFKAEIISGKGTHVILTHERGSVNRTGLYTISDIGDAEKSLRDSIRKYLNEKISQSSPTEYTAVFSRWKVGVAEHEGALHRYVVDVDRSSRRYYENLVELPYLDSGRF